MMLRATRESAGGRRRAWAAARAAVRQLRGSLGLNVHVVLEKCEVGVADPLLNVLALAREQVVHDVDDVALREEKRQAAAARGAPREGGDGCREPRRAAGARETTHLHHQRVHQVAADKAGAARDEDAALRGRGGRAADGVRGWS